MLLIGLISLLIAIPLYSSSNSWATPTLLTRITAIILLFSAALSFNGRYVMAIGSGLGLYSGLFHVTTVTQFMEIFLFTVGAIILLPWASSTSNIKGFSAVPSIAEYPMIILFTMIGASFLISSADLVSMYLSIELQSFAVYILAAIYRNSESATSAGLKYFLLGALSSALILLGSSIIYAYTGLTNFENIYMISAVNISNENISQGVVLGVLIIGVGFLFKVAAAPFHHWAPDVYDGVPTIVTTWLTVMPKISIFVFLLELQITHQANLLDNMEVWKNLILITSMLSLVIGTVVGLAQYRLKRLLSFSTISHVGFLLLALSVQSEESITSFLFYLMQYSITNLDAFFVILAFGYIINQSSKNTDIAFISQLKGQFVANPILGLSLAVCLFSMAGIPPLVGFFAKYMVLYSAIENGYYFLALLGILASVVSAAYYLRIIRVIHFDPNLSINKDNANGEVVVLTSTHCYIIAVLTLFIVLFILSPSLFLNCSNLLALSLFTT